MAINLLSGKMLEANLLRDNVNLSVEADLLFFDVANNRLGVNNALPAADLDVTGETKSTTATLGNVAVSTDVITTTAGDLHVNSVTGDVVFNGAITLDSTGVITGQTVLTLATLSNSTLTLSTGTGLIDIQSSSALQLPSGTDLEQPVGVAGMMRWNEDDTQLEYFDGTQWRGPQTAFVPTSEQFTPTAGQTDFVLNKSATTDSILVVMNGLVQDPQGGAVYSVIGVTGQVLHFVTPLTISDIISVRYLAP